MIIDNLFPIPIGFFESKDCLTEETIKFLSEQKQRPNLSNTSSEDRYILKQKQLSDMRTFIEKSVYEYFMATYCPKNDVRLKLTQSWLNWSKPGESHHEHSHPNSLISGCFYISGNKETDKIYFVRRKYQQLKFPPAAWNPYNSETWWFPAETGKLILFPSYLTHRVEPVEGTETRISLAFNTFPIGDIGSEDELTALHLEK